MKITFARIIFVAVIALTGFESRADQVEGPDGFDTGRVSVVARGIVVAIAGWPTGSIVEAAIRITDPLQSGLIGLERLSAQSNTISICGGEGLKSMSRSTAESDLVGREIIFVASRSGGRLNLIRCIDPELWSNDLYGPPPSVVSVSNAIEAIESVMREFAAGHISPSESAAKRAEILNQHEWLRLQVEETKKQREEIHVYISEYKSIRAAYTSGAINEAVMRDRLSSLYARSEPYSDFIRRLAAKDGVVLGGSSGSDLDGLLPKEAAGRELRSSGSDLRSSGSNLDTRQ